MNALVVYHTVHGNTEQVARAIAEALGGSGDVVVKSMADAGPDDLRAADLVVAGSPTHAWSMSKPAKEFFQRLGAERYQGKAAAFDTKFEPRLAGSAAGKIARALRRLGFEPVGEPQHFFVTGMQGPLKEGELDRAREFGAQLRSALPPAE